MSTSTTEKSTGGIPPAMSSSEANVENRPNNNDNNNNDSNNNSNNNNSNNNNNNNNSINKSSISNSSSDMTDSSLHNSDDPICNGDRNNFTQNEDEVIKKKDASSPTMMAPTMMAPELKSLAESGANDNALANNGDHAPTSHGSGGDASKGQASTSRSQMNGAATTSKADQDISQERERRIVALERKVKDNENEILLLKTCVCDLLRRIDHPSKLKSKEARKTSLISHNSLSSITDILPTPIKSPKSEELPEFSERLPSPRRRHSRQNSFDMSHSRTTTEGDASAPIMKLVQRRSSSSLRRSLSRSNSKDDPPKSKDDAKIKFYIRGRALSFYPPTSYRPSKTDGGLPEQSLELDWVYGYRGRDSRNNLVLLPSGDLVYNMAAVVILYNRGLGSQRHYVEHNDDVKCIAVHPDGVIVASGQVAGHDKDEGKPHVRVWSSLDLNTLHVIGLGVFDRAVSCLAFSQKDDGKYLAVVDEANEHVISLWDWKRELKLSDNKGYNEAVFGVEFSPTDAHSLVSYGRSHIAFWTITADEKLTKRMGIFDKHPKPKFVLSVAFTMSGDVVSGDSNGNIFIWGQGSNKISHFVKEAHQGGVFSLRRLANGTFLSGGGKDKRILQWSDIFKKTANEVELPGTAGAVRAIVEGGTDEAGCAELIVGTTKNCILDGTLESGFGFVMQGHVDEMWGLATHPTTSLFVTCAYDSLVFLWDAATHETIWRKTIEQESAQTAAFHPTVNLVAVGTRSGRWIVYDIETQDEVVSNSDSTEQVDVLKYSPDGEYLAVGTHENSVAIYRCQDDGKAYKKVGKLTGHSSFVTHLDWSKDNQYIQTNSGDYEILYWHANSCRQVVSASAMKDVEWQSWTCVFGFPVMGIWPEGADGTDINSCCAWQHGNVVATGDDFGKVNLFAFPSTALKAQGHQNKGHSSHVTCVRFLHDGQHLLSVGGKDSSVLQWRVKSAVGQ